MRGPGKRPRADLGRKQVRAPISLEPADTLEEQWLPVPGWEKFYRVSTLGRVWSMHQFGRMIIGMEVDGGYRVIKMRDNHRYAHIAVHVLVLLAFRGPRPDGQEGCHNDGNARNSVLTNLRWDTKQGNAADRVIHGTDRYSTGYILDKATVTEIRIRTDITDKAWADALGVSLITIRNARRGDTWKHVSTPPVNRRH